MRQLGLLRFAYVCLRRPETIIMPRFATSESNRPAETSMCGVQLTPFNEPSTICVSFRRINCDHVKILVTHVTQNLQHLLVTKCVCVCYSWIQYASYGRLQANFEFINSHGHPGQSTGLLERQGDKIHPLEQGVSNSNVALLKRDAIQDQASVANSHVQSDVSCFHESFFAGA